MNNKITFAVALLLILAITVAFAVSAETSDYTGSVEEADRLLQNAKIAVDARTKNKALDELSLYLKDNKIDPKTSGYEELEKEILEENYVCGKLYLDGIDVSMGTAKNKVAINRLSAFMKEHPFSSHGNYGSFEECYLQKLKEQNNEVSKNRLALDENAVLDEYNLKPEFCLDFDKKTGNTVFGNVSGVDKDGNKISNFAGVETHGGNKHFSIKYRNALANDNSPLHTFASWRLNNGKKGEVFEFDFTTFGELPNGMIDFECAENATNKTRIFPHFLRIMADGSFTNKYIDKPFIEDAIVKGEWLHIAFVYHCETKTIDFYVEYEYLGSAPVVPKNETREFTVTNIRTGFRNNTGEFSIDNFNVYPGESVRILDKFENMTEEEAFTFYVSLLTKEKETDKNKYLGYQYAMKNLYKYFIVDEGHFVPEYENNAEIKNAVDILLNFKIDEVENRIRLENKGEFISLVEEIEVYEQIPSTLEKRTVCQKKINEFLQKCGDMILEDGEVLEKRRVFAVYDSQIKAELKANEFTHLMNMANKTVTTSFLEEYIKRGNEIYNDPNFDEKLGENPNYSDFKNALEIYKNIDKRLNEVQKIENSNIIIECVSLISVFETEEEWKENYDYINKYCLILRKIVRDKNYDEKIDGVVEAVEKFKIIDRYFYDDLQKTHIKVIENEFLKYDKTDSYLKKVGICSFIERYLNTNDIDYENSTVKMLIDRFHSCKKEVEGQKEEFEELLRTNTLLFIDVVEKLKTADGFEEKYRLFKEAQTYYYTMNSGSEEAKSAIEIYEICENEMKKIFDHTDKFLMNTELLKKAKVEREVFHYLVNCLNYSHLAEDSLDGVRVAKEEFKKINESYIVECNSVNGELDSITEVVENVRNYENFR